MNQNELSKLVAGARYTVSETANGISKTFDLIYESFDGEEQLVKFGVSDGNEKVLVRIENLEGVPDFV
ncbi:hypothetical protein ACYZTM_25540 [Pseudomonas sp. MDT2-39-1]